MVYIRSRKFLCCIPVRAGVFVLSAVGTAGGSLIAVMGWIQVSELTLHPLSTTDTIALYLHTVIFTILALLSLFGFIGTLIKQRDFVNAYASGLTLYLALSLCSGIYALYSLFHKNSQADITKCLNGSTDSVTREVCNNGIAIMKGVAVALYVAMWLLIIYAYIIVSNYVDQLDDEESVKETTQMIKAISQPAPVTTYTSFGMPNGGYATQVSQSHGMRSGNMV